MTDVLPAGPGPGSGDAGRDDAIGLDDPSAGDGQRRRNQLNLAVDVGVILAVLTDQAVGFTGLAVHEWLGIAIGIALVFHVLLHGDWVARTASRLRRVPRRRQFLAVVDVALFTVMVLVIFSGIATSRHALAGVGGDDRFWEWLHTESARAAMVLVAVHVALGWDWLVKVARVTWRRRG